MWWSFRGPPRKSSSGDEHPWNLWSLLREGFAPWHSCTPSCGVLDTQNFLPDCQDCQALCAQPKKLAIIPYYSHRLSLEILFSCSILQGINFLAGGKFLPVRGKKMSLRHTLPGSGLTWHRGEQVSSCVPKSLQIHLARVHCRSKDTGPGTRTCPADCITEHLPPCLSRFYCGNRILQRSRELRDVKHPEQGKTRHP